MVKETVRLFEEDVRPGQEDFDLAKDRYVGNGRVKYIMKYIVYCGQLGTHKSQCSMVLDEQCSFGKIYGHQTIMSKDT